jgi:hypothetical protein
VHALARQRVEIGRQRSDQGLALAGAHLGDPTAVQDHAADELHVEVPHPKHALAGLAHHAEGLGQQIVERRAPGQTLAELGGLGRERLIRELRQFGFERVDARHRLHQGFDQPLVAAAEELLEWIEHRGIL